MRSAGLLAFAFSFVASQATAQTIRTDVEFLASEQCEGRAVGSAGHDLARDHIVNQMKAAGLAPAGSDGWFVPLEVVSEVVPPDAATLKIGNAVLARG